MVELDGRRSDKGMRWVPPSGWLTKLSISARASSLNYDLAVDASGQNAPSLVQAGLLDRSATESRDEPVQIWPALIAAALVLALATLAGARVGRSPTPAR